MQISTLVPRFILIFLRDLFPCELSFTFCEFDTVVFLIISTVVDPRVGHNMRTFSIYLSPLSFWSTLRRGVLSTSWCCPSRPCVVFLTCMHLASFLELSLSRQLPCFLMVWPQYASFLALTVSNSSLFTPALSRTHSFVFFAVHETRRIFLSPSSQRRQDVFLHCFSV